MLNSKNPSAAKNNYNFKMLSKDYNRVTFKKTIFFSQNIVMENPKLEEENIITDSENLFRLEKTKKTVNATIY